MSKSALPAHRDPLSPPLVSETGLSAHSDLLSPPSVSESGFSAHLVLFLSSSVQKDGSRGIAIIVIGRWGFPRPGLGAPPLAPAGLAGRKTSSATPKPSPADPSQRLGYPCQARFGPPDPSAQRSSVLTGDNRWHYPPYPSFCQPSPQAGWRISRCTIVISSISPSPLRGRAILR